MVIGTFNEIEVGKIHIAGQVHDGNGGVLKNQPMFIIREATKEEYLNYCREMCGWTPGPEWTDKSNSRFYLVSID